MGLNFESTESIQKSTLPETNSSHLKRDGWKMIVSFWDGGTW